MELLLLKYGYVLLFAGVIVEGEAVLVAGSLLASRGYFNIGTVALVALAANTLSAQFYYTAARVRGRRWFEAKFPKNSPYRRIIDWVAHRDNWVLLISRFVFGFRIVIPAACGAFGMPAARFTVINVIAGLLWVVPISVAGYYFGEELTGFLRGARHYTLTALVGGLGILAVFFAWRHIQRVRSIFENLEWSDLHNAIPFVMGLMGALNILAAILPSSETLLRGVRGWLPLEVSQGSRTLMLFTGVALLQVTQNLAKRKQLAWWVAVIALSFSLLLHVTSGFDVQNSLIALILLVYLIYFRRRFYTRSDPASLRKGLMVTPLLLLMVFFYGLTGFAATSLQFHWPASATPFTEAVRGGILIVKPDVVPVTRYARLFLNSLQFAGWITRLYILILILRPFISRDRLEAPKADIDRIFERYGKESVSALAIQRDKHHLLVAERQGLVAFATGGSIAMACGDPLVSDDLFARAVQDYIDHCGRHGWTPCVYFAAEERLPVYHSLKWQSSGVSEEAIVNLLAFEHSVNIRSLGIVQRYDRAAGTDPLIDEQLEEVTEDWLELRHMGETGFTAGNFSLEQLGQGPVFVLGNPYRIEAFSTWLPYKNGKAVVLAILRQRRHTPHEIVRAFVVESLRLLKESGFEEASLTVATIDREQIESFQPVWKPRYLAYPRGANVSKITRTLATIRNR
ncbi:MAG TPA: phosphatidylglycerol lysyltransferase domain-containing protein [Terriglobia bacterium]